MSQFYPWKRFIVVSKFGLNWASLLRRIVLVLARPNVDKIDDKQMIISTTTPQCRLSEDDYKKLEVFG